MTQATTTLTRAGTNCLPHGRRSNRYMTSLSAVFPPLLMLEHESKACSLDLAPNPNRKR